MQASRLAVAKREKRKKRKQ